MLKNIFKKEHRVYVLFMKYLEDIKKAQENFRLAMNTCLTVDNACEDVAFLTDMVQILFLE